MNDQRLYLMAWYQRAGVVANNQHGIFSAAEVSFCNQSGHGWLSAWWCWWTISSWWRAIGAVAVWSSIGMLGRSVVDSFSDQQASVSDQRVSDQWCAPSTSLKAWTFSLVLSISVILSFCFGWCEWSVVAFSAISSGIMILLISGSVMVFFSG